MKIKNKDFLYLISAIIAFGSFIFGYSLVCISMMADKIQNSGAHIFKENTSPGESLYFLDPDGHKFEIHVGDWKTRINHYKGNSNLKNPEYFI